MDVSMKNLARTITAVLAVSTVTGLMFPQRKSWPDAKRYLQQKAWFEAERYPQRKSWSDTGRNIQRNTWSDEERDLLRISWTNAGLFPQRNTWLAAQQYPQRRSLSDEERYPQRNIWSDEERYPQRNTWSDEERYPQRNTWSDEERYPQRNSWSGLPFRRQVTHTECNSYLHLMNLVMTGFHSHINSGFSDMSDVNKPVTSEILRSFSNAMCRALAEVVPSLHAVIEKCPNSEQVNANLHVFGGLCTDKGETTPFLDNLISDFNTSYALTPACLEQISRILFNCNGAEMEPQKDMVGGPKAYKRIIIDQEKCNSKGFDEIDSNDCGDIRSLKKLACILDIFFRIGPGVTFSMSDFQSLANN